MKTTTLNLANVHVVVVDESQLASKKAAIRIYDAANNLLGNILLATDRKDTNILSVIKPVVLPPPPPPPPPPPMPTSVTLTPASVSLPDNSPVGTAVSTVAVATSDGSAFAGTLTIGVNNMVALSGSTVALTRALTAADVGAHSMLITATENAGTASATLVLNATAVAPASPQITVNPAAPQIPDTTPKGSVVATYAVTMSDGSSFAGTVAFGAPNMDSGGIFALVSTGPASGQIIVNPNGPGVGPNMTTITDHVTLVATT